MNNHITLQSAYAGLFSIRDITTGELIRGGGVVATRPRLYDTAAASAEAAAAITWTKAEPVRLIADCPPRNEWTDQELIANTLKLVRILHDSKPVTSSLEDVTFSPKTLEQIDRALAAASRNVPPQTEQKE